MVTKHELKINRNMDDGPLILFMQAILPVLEIRHKTIQVVLPNRIVTYDVSDCLFLLPTKKRL